jgi:hypothetical protein
MEVLLDIPVNLELKEILTRMRIRGENEYFERTARELLEIARQVARPKAVYEVSKVTNRNRNSLEIGGVKFTSNLLRINLDNVDRVFPYVATCGQELDEINIPSPDITKSYCFDVIKQTVIHLATDYLENYLNTSYALGPLSRMEPGAEFWPLIQQKELFSIFGNVDDLIGVSLNESCMMSPVKSSSGIFFTSEKRFDSCQLCPIRTCSERRAAYDSELAQIYRERA